MDGLFSCDQDLLFGGLEAGGTKMVCAVGDGKGNVLSRISLPTEDPQRTVAPMIEFFRRYPIAALGIGSFGPVDLRKSSPTYGRITSTPKLAWRDFNIVGAFRQALQIPVAFDTDVNAAALGESVFGATRDVDNSLYITVGTGVGVGIIVDKKPYHGRIHPEGGHILLRAHPDDPMQVGCCPYHSHCFEGLAAGPSIEKRWGRKGQFLTERDEVWALEAYYIGQALVDYTLLLCPDRIVVGGGVAKQPDLLPRIRREVEKQLNGYVPLPDLENYIVAPALRDDQGVLGAMELAKNTYWEEKT